MDVTENPTPTSLPGPLGNFIFCSTSSPHSRASAKSHHFQKIGKIAVSCRPWPFPTCLEKEVDTLCCWGAGLSTHLYRGLHGGPSEFPALRSVVGGPNPRQKSKWKWRPSLLKMSPIGSKGPRPAGSPEGHGTNARPPQPAALPELGGCFRTHHQHSECWLLGAQIMFFIRVFQG